MMPSRLLLWLISFTAVSANPWQLISPFPPVLPSNSSSSNKVAAAAQQRANEKKKRTGTNSGHSRTGLRVTCSGDPLPSNTPPKSVLSREPSFQSTRKSAVVPFRRQIVDTQSRRRRRRRGEQLSRWPWRANFPPSFTPLLLSFPYFLALQTVPIPWTWPPFRAEG